MPNYRVKADPVRAHSDLSLASAMPSSPREDDGLGLGLLETNGVVVRPPQVGRGTSLQSLLIYVRWMTSDSILQVHD